jgi:Right handed beta helix region
VDERAASNGPLLRVNAGAGGTQIFYFTLDGNSGQNPPASTIPFQGDLVFLDQGALYSSLLMNSQNIALEIEAQNVRVAYNTIASPALWGVWTDSLSTNDFVAYDNTFVGSGANAIIFGGTNAYIGFNQFYGNHHACPFGVNGGQLLITQYSNTVWIDHNTVADGPAYCDVPESQFWADGMELYGSNLTLTDNTVINNGGHGIGVGGVQTTWIANIYTNAVIAENNRRQAGFSGIWVGTAVSGNSGIQIASAIVGGGQCSGITFQESAPGSSVTNTCISGNQVPGVSVCPGCTIGLAGVTANACPVASPMPVARNSINIEAVYHLLLDLQTPGVPAQYLFNEIGLSAWGSNVVLTAAQNFAAQMNTIALLGTRASILLDIFSSLQSQLGEEGALLRVYLLARS